MSACAVYENQPSSVVLRVHLGEHFDFRSIHSFRHLCTEKLEVTAEVIVDMSQTRYVDSSGAALLHCLQHWINAPAVDVQVINCCPDVRRILSLCKSFDNINIV